MSLPLTGKLSGSKSRSINLLMSFIHDDFLLSNDQAVRLYHEYAKDEPILDFHNHLPPDEISNNRRFENVAEAWLEADHYKWRAMRCKWNTRRTGNRQRGSERKYLVGGNHSPHLGKPYHWTHLELKRCFGIDNLLKPDTAEEIWEAANEQLKSPDFSARGMLEKFKVKPYAQQMIQQTRRKSTSELPKMKECEQEYIQLSARTRHGE